MTWDEVKHQASPVPFSILATDLSSRCLAKAEAGIYSEFEVARGLSPQRRDRYFAREEGGFRVKPEVAQAITWKRLNLMDRLDGLGPFEIILCRNVLIYFDRATRSRILDSLAARLAPGGVLILGGAETVIGLSNATQAAPDRPGLYVRAASGGRP